MKKRVSLHLLASLVGPLCSPSDDEWSKMASIDASDTEKLTALVRENVSPHFDQFDRESQGKMRDSLEYFLGVSGSGIERIFPAFHIPIEPPESARNFFSIVWVELFGAPIPSAVDSDLFVRDNSDGFVNSLRKVGFG